MGETERARLHQTIRELQQTNARLAREVGTLVRQGDSFQKQVQSLLGRVDQLLAENAALREQLLGSRAGGAGISPNTPSSQVPPYLKPPPSRRAKRPGRPKGHTGVARPKPEQIDRIEEHRLSACPHCAGPVRAQHSAEGRLKVRIRFIEDVPERRPEVTEHRVHQYYCRRCRRTVEPAVTAALPGARLGVLLLSRTAVQHYLYGIPTAKIVKMLHQEHGFRVTEGGLLLAWRSLAEALQQVYDQIRGAVQSAGVLHADETGWRVNGITQWLWCFCTKREALYLIDPTRSSGVATDLLGTAFGGTLIVDFFPVYNACGAREVQYCLAHLLREFRKIRARRPRLPDELLEFERRLKRLLRAAIRYVARGPAPPQRAAARTRYEERLVELVEQPYRDPDVVRLVKRILRSGHGLFTFVTDAHVEATNNWAELNLRPAVVSRKNSYGNRSQAGARTQALLMSVFRTFELRGLDVIQTTVAEIAAAIQRRHQLKPLSASDG